MDESPQPDYAPTSLPPKGARVLAFVAILVGGLCGGLIGYGVADISCTDGCGSTTSGLAAVVGAALGAAGVGVVSVLALRAMGEWRSGQRRTERF